MKNIICEKQSDSNASRCIECGEVKNEDQFYKYKKTNTTYKKCIKCFNKKIKCPECGKELNRTYLKKHLERKHNGNIYGSGLNPEFDLNTNDDSPNDDKDVEFNRTLIVGPSFCGKTYLLFNKIKLITKKEAEKQIKIITRSPEQYIDSDLGFELEEDFESKTLDDYKGCVVVFDDMLDSNQKLIDPFFTRGRHSDLDVYYLSQSYFDLPKRTIRNNSNIIILFQQTLKDVEHIYRDIAGFDMSYEEFKNLCREAWNEKFNYLLINRLKDKDKGRYSIRNESNKEYKEIIPQTKPF